LFPGLERSQLIAGSNVGKHEATKNRKGDYVNDSRNPPASVPSPDQRRFHAASEYFMPRSKQGSDIAHGAENKQNGQWPNGSPPKGPRNHVERINQYSAKRQSNENSNVPKSNRGSSLSSQPVTNIRSLTQNTVRDGTARHKRPESASDLASGLFIRSGEKNKADVGTSNGDKDEITADNDISVSSPVQATTGIFEKQNGPEKNLPAPSNPQLFEVSLTQSVSSPDFLSVPRIHTPKANSYEKSSDIGPRIGAYNTETLANKIQAPIMSSPNNLRRRDIAHVMQNIHRASSEAPSVSSTSSSVAGKSTSSSVSSSLRTSICHSCKKPPFKDRLKECFECSRHYHKGCAKPKDRYFLAKVAP
jgi:hypothetical protein